MDWLRAGLIGTAAYAFFAAAPVASAQERAFDVPAMAANRAIPEFARQAGIQIVAPGQRLRSIRTRPVRGRYEVAQALVIFLRGTGLTVVSRSEQTIVLGFVDAPAGAKSAGPPPLPPKKSPPRPLPSAAVPVPAPSEIVVTGSNLHHAGYASQVLRSTIDRSLMNLAGVNDAAGMLRLTPQHVATQSDATAGTGFSVETGSSYVNFRGLSPTYGSRSLLLLDGQRIVPTSTGGQVDLALIPSVLVDRVESVTGGASAIYGSDAVAGVVNYIVDNRFSGAKVELSSGVTAHGDGRHAQASAAFGRDLGQRGHLVLGMEYHRQEGIGRCAAVRDWCARSWGLFVNSADVPPGSLNGPGAVAGYDVPGSATYGQPNYVVGPGASLAYTSEHGVIRNFTSPTGTSNTSFAANFPATSPPLSVVDKRFSADGRELVPFDPGTYVPKNVAGQVQGSDGTSMYADQPIQTPLKSVNAYAAADFDIGSNLDASVRVFGSRRSGSATSITSTNRSTMAMRADNAFLSPQVAALLNGASFSLGKDVDGEVTNEQTFRASMLTGRAGLSGTLGSRWTFDLSYQAGWSRRLNSSGRVRYNDAYVMAIDAIRDPINPGRIICRPLSADLLARFSANYQEELRDLYSHCVPLNLFGIGNMDPAAVDFVWRERREAFHYRQQVISGKLQGVATLPGGTPLSLAAGVERRYEAGRVTHGDISPNAFIATFGLDYRGRIRVSEAFGEAEVRLLPGADEEPRLLLNAALRHTDNVSRDEVTDQSKTVSATSWKLGAVADPLDWLRFRGSRSRDIRAAGFRELFQKTVPTEEGTAQGRVNNNRIGAADKSDATPIFTGGSFVLTPEKADTLTLGALVGPKMLRGLSLSLDWYSIRLKDLIANLTGQRVADLCIDRTLLCDRIAFASPTDITRIDAGQANVGSAHVAGFDLEVRYQLPADQIFPRLGGTFSAGLLLNHQYRFVVRQSVATQTINYAGQTGPMLEGTDFYPGPKWSWNANLAYDGERLGLGVLIRHVGEGSLNAAWVGPDDPAYDPTLADSVSRNRVGARTYVTTSVTVPILIANGFKHARFFGVAENLFDRDPPPAPGGGTSLLLSAYPTNPVYFDTFGRRFKAGLRIRF